MICLLHLVSTPPDIIGVDASTNLHKNASGVSALELRPSDVYTKSSIICLLYELLLPFATPSAGLPFVAALK